MTKILVMAPSWVGDTIMATPAIALLRITFPDAGIIVLGRDYIGGVLKANPHISGFIPLASKTPDAETMAGLVACNFDAAAIMPNSLRSAWLVRRIGVPRRAGYSRHARRLLLTDPIPFDAYEWQTPVEKVIGRRAIAKPGVSKPGPWNKPPRHMVHYYLRVAARTAAALGVQVDIPAGTPGTPPLVVPVTSEARLKVDALLAEHGLNDRVLVGIAPGAANGAAKLWPPRNFAAVADRLAADFDASIISLGGPREASVTDELAAGMKAPVHRLGELLDLEGAIALIDRLSTAVVVDSGAMHIAAARGTPVVGIFGPTDWNVTGPWTRDGVVARASPECAPCLLKHCPIDHRCMTSLTVETVTQAAAEMLARRASREESVAG